MKKLKLMALFALVTAPAVMADMSVLKTDIKTEVDSITDGLWTIMPIAVGALLVMFAWRMVKRFF